MQFANGQFRSKATITLEKRSAARVKDPADLSTLVGSDDRAFVTQHK